VVSFLFVIAKATRQDASNPNVYSEMNPDIGRVPTARNWAQLFCKDMWLSCMCVEWSEVSLQNRWLHWTIIRHFGKKVTQVLNNSY